MPPLAYLAPFSIHLASALSFALDPCKEVGRRPAQDLKEQETSFRGTGVVLPPAFLFCVYFILKWTGRSKMEVERTLGGWTGKGKVTSSLCCCQRFGEQSCFCRFPLHPRIPTPLPPLVPLNELEGLGRRNPGSSHMQQWWSMYSLAYANKKGVEQTCGLLC